MKSILFLGPILGMVSILLAGCSTARQQNKVMDHCDVSKGNIVLENKTPYTMQLTQHSVSVLSEDYGSTRFQESIPPEKTLILENHSTQLQEEVTLDFVVISFRQLGCLHLEKRVGDVHRKMEVGKDGLFRPVVIRTWDIH